MKDKKGFLFVLSIFLVLSYIMMSLSVWVKGVELSERAYSEIYKESNIELAVAELSNEKVKYVSDLIMQNALYDLSSYSIDHPLKQDDKTLDKIGYVKDAFRDYFINGSPSANYFQDKNAPSQKLASSFGGWLQSLNESLKGTGVFIDSFNLIDFNVWQESIDAVNYSVKFNISMRDNAGTTKLSREYDIKSAINITGFVDPAIARESRKKGTTIYRRFFFGPYTNSSYMAPTKISDISAGQGWFYGYVVKTDEASLVDEKYRPLYILMGTYDDIKATDGYENFSAYIVTSKPIQESSSCAGKTNEKNTFNAIQYESPKCEASIDQNTQTTKPFVVVSSDLSLPSCYNLVTNAQGEKCALIIAGANPQEVLNNPTSKFNKVGTSVSGVYNIENLRDFTLCGYYVKSEKAPSYLQRMLVNAYNLNSTYGVETFLIGEYVSSENSYVFTKYSALDREMFKEIKSDSFIRGQTGCKSEGVCSSDPSTGVFGLSENATRDYGVSDITCDNGAARCK